MDVRQRHIQAQAIYNAGLERVATTPVPDGQKFAPGTRVWVKKDLGPSMRYFRSGLWATVQYTYAHAFGWSNDVKSYSLDFGNGDTSAWYYEHQLSLEEEKD